MTDEEREKELNKKLYDLITDFVKDCEPLEPGTQQIVKDNWDELPAKQVKETK